MMDAQGRDLIQRLADSVELLLQMRNGLMPLVNSEAVLAEARAYLAIPKSPADEPAMSESREPASVAEQHNAPTDEELTDLWSWSHGQDTGPWPTQQHCYARAVLSRWAGHIPQPIPISKRLPGPEDCAECDADISPWCWAGKDIDGGWEWTQLSVAHFESNYGRVMRGSGYTHWLPHWAIPVPQGES